MMGGTESVEFMVASDAGEDWIASCAACGYAANVEKATSELPAVDGRAGPGGARALRDAGRAHDRASSPRFAGGAPGRAPDQDARLRARRRARARAAARRPRARTSRSSPTRRGAREIRPAPPRRSRAALGAAPGSLGAVGVRGLPVLADAALRGRRDMTTGANQDDFHLRGVDVERDLAVSAWHDLREVAAGEACPLCGARSRVQKTIEVGHIFKLGTRYSEALGATRARRGRQGACRS